MKKSILNIFLVVAALILFADVKAQIRTPAASPGAKITQTIGLADVTVEYSRPAIKGRTVFGADGLVPYGKIWRTGANSAVKISIGDDVKVGGSALKKGDYAILTVPNTMEWTVNFYTYETGNWASYVEKTPVAAVVAKVNPLSNSVQSFLISFGNITDDSGDLEISWDKVSVSVPMKFEVDSKVVASIDKVLAGPNENDYYNAGSYYYTSKKDLNKALMWVQKATAVAEPRFWQVRTEALILADLGRKAEAIVAAKKSLDLAKVANNDDYVKMNEKSIAEWSAAPTSPDMNKVKKADKGSKSK